MADDKDTKETKPDDKEIVIPEEDKEKPPEGYTEEEWADLSDEEKAGILSKDEDEEKPSDKKEELSEDELKKIAEDKAEKKDDEDTKKPDETPKETEDEAKKVSDEELLSFRPRIDKGQLPKRGDEIIPDDIQKELDEIQKKFDDGELQRSEFDLKRDALNRKIMRYNDELYDTAKETAIQELTWKEEQRAFFRSRPEYANGWTKEGTTQAKALYGALNEVVKDLDGKEENAGLSGMAILIKADKIVKESFGMVEKTDTSKDKGKTTPDKDKDKKPNAQIPDEKTLGDLPEAQRNSTDGPFADLDRLSGEAYEAALEKLTPEQRKRYEMSKV